MKILLLEDEKNIAKNIKEYLKLKQNWDVDIASTLKEAEEKLEKNYYDILLFDIMLPDGESYDLAKKIKQDFDDLPIIFLTAKGELEDKIQGFNLGADDYITKPFEMQELIARIQAIAKRYGIGKLNIKGVDLDLDNRKVSKDGKEIKLNKTEFLILEFLVSNRGKIVERSQLIEYVWGDDIFDEKADRKLDVYIANIRKKLGKDFIETIKGVGYKV